MSEEFDSQLEELYARKSVIDGDIKKIRDRQPFWKCNCGTILNKVQYESFNVCPYCAKANDGEKIDREGGI